MRTTMYMDKGYVAVSRVENLLCWFVGTSAGFLLLYSLFYCYLYS
jgi:hypothetical protein